MASKPASPVGGPTQVRCTAAQRRGHISHTGLSQTLRATGLLVAPTASGMCRQLCL